MTESRWRTSRLALAALAVSTLAAVAVVAAPAQAAPVSAARGDWNLDGKAELLVRMPDGTLAEYVWIQGRMHYLRPFSTQFGSSVRLYSPGDANYDGRTDLLVDRDGTLILYGLRTDGRLSSGREVGRGFSGITLVTPGTNWRDKTPQGNLEVRMYGITASGDMYLYMFTDPYVLRSGGKVGFGWNVYSQVIGVGDVTGDGYGDVVAVQDGNLWLYRGNANGGLSARTLAGNGWSGQVSGPGDLDGDGYGELVLRHPDGYVHVYYSRTGRIGGGSALSFAPGPLVP